MAVTDANWTQTPTGRHLLRGPGQLEQQFVTGNQQALNVAVRRYKAAFARELSKLPAFLRTASAKLNLPGGPRGAGRAGSRVQARRKPVQPGG